MIKMADPSAQYLQLEDQMTTKVLAVLRSGQYVNGPQVEEFEKQWAQRHGALGAVGVGNGTDALELALEALELPSGSEVIVPDLTFIATAEAVSRVGLKPVFCDVDPDLFTIEAEHIKQVLSAKTKAVIPVHLYGQACAMDEILELSRQHELRVIEDCSQAHLGRYRNQPVGSFGDIGTFSFYPSKNLGACGHAGAVITNDQKLHQRMKTLSNHGRNSSSEHEVEGRNSQMDEIQAAILNIKLEHLQEWTQQRVNNADLYRQELIGIKAIGLPQVQDDVFHTYHQFVIQVDPLKRDQLRDHLNRNGIQSGVHYDKLLSDYSFYTQKSNSHDFAIKGIEKKILSLPVHERLKEKEILRVIKSLRSFFDGL
jgi:dTDP-4-amino-4,6-dideoxygalactose transaminase